MRKILKENTVWILLMSSAILSSCLKDEIPVDKHQSGDVVSSEVKLSFDYKFQLYYNIETDQMVKSNLKTDWDLGFECNNDGYHIKLNAAKAMRVANTGTQDFTAISDTNGAHWKWDNPNGDLDSTAFGNWQDDLSVFILDLGYDLEGNHIGFKKVKILSVNSNAFNIEWADLNQNQTQTATIPKEFDKNYSTFSLINNQIVDIEPNKEAWDLHFTQYSHLFEPDFAYTVTGALGNPNGTQFAQLDSVNFDSIDLAFATNTILNTKMDELGYDWKEYSFNEGSFTMIPNRAYIILTQEGFYYKFRFVDFYDDQGQKGNPKFEFQQL